MYWVGTSCCGEPVLVAKTVARMSSGLTDSGEAVGFITSILYCWLGGGPPSPPPLESVSGIGVTRGDLET